MLKNYINIAIRNLRNNSTFALLNIAGLGLSIACCTLIFLLVRHHLSFDQFHTKANRVAAILTESRREVEGTMNLVPYPMGAALRQDYAILEKTAMVSGRRNTLVTVANPGQAPAKFQEENIQAFTEPELFDMLDFPLVQGSYASFAAPYRTLITEKLARKYFGTTDAVGKTFRINSRYDVTVAGVLKDIPENTDFQYDMYTSWATILAVDTSSRGMLENWSGISGDTRCCALFREGHAMAELNEAFPAFHDKYHSERPMPWYYKAVPITTVHLNPDYGSGIAGRYLWTLGIIGLFLLLTACFNFVNMATAQAMKRSREVGVRKTMGSTRTQLFWQFMSETGLIVLLATAIGVITAQFALPYMNRLTGSELRFQLEYDWSLYGFLAVLMLLVSFLAGAYPGLVLSGFRPAMALRGGAVKAGGFSLRRLLVGTQFAISQVLIIGAVVVTSQMEYAQNADLGFRKDGIINLDLPGQDHQKFHTLKTELSQISGIENVTLCMYPPASQGNWSTGIRLQNKTENEEWLVNFKFGDESYLKTFGLSLVAGRNLTPCDTVREFLVNETVAKKFGFSDPNEMIGKQISVSGSQAFPVVGVVKDFHNHSFRQDIQPQVISSAVEEYGTCSAKINLQNAKSILAGIEKSWTGLFPEYFYEAEFLDARLADFYEQESIILQVIRLFAGIAVFIGCLGLYGLAAFMIARKTKEIGIRKTLGAGTAGILWLFGKEYTRLIIIAFLVAAPIGWWAMNNWLQDFIFHIKIGAGIFAVSLLTTFLIAIVTVGTESVRAALMNPVKSLRSE